MLEVLQFLNAAQARNEQVNIMDAVNQHAELLNQHSQAIAATNHTLSLLIMVLLVIFFASLIANLVFVAMLSRIRYRLKQLEPAAATK